MSNYRSLRKSTKQKVISIELMPKGATMKNTSGYDPVKAALLRAKKKMKI